MRRNCNVCRQPYNAQRPTSKYCSARCRMRNHDNPGLYPQVSAADPPVSGPTRQSAPKSGSNSLLKATLAELEAAGAADSLLGQQALTIAEEMSGQGMGASGMAALSKELSRVMVEALRAGQAAMPDALDELRARREKKLAGG